MENNTKSQVRTRIAPSPTGYMHIGTLRTALYSYLVAKQAGGQFVLRLEDTDQKRLVEGAAQAIYDGLAWAGINCDEGPNVGGEYGPYVQSERLALYKKYAQELIDKDHAYYCFCDEKTLEEMKAEQAAKKQAPKYDRRCLTLSKEDIQVKLEQNQPHVIRMKIPSDRFIEVNDIVRGKVTYKSDDLDDQVLVKSDGFPTYHLALVVDDHLMNITHVTRTEEWLPSTPKHILLYEYFGWEAPQWAHLPLLLNTDKSKMSKRKGDVAVGDYIKKGYLPQAMINYLAFLGWNPASSSGALAKGEREKEKEIYSMEELLQDFKLEKVHKAGAIFNIEKLDWYNSYYLRQLPENELLEKFWPYLPAENNFSDEQIKKMLNLEKERSRNLMNMAENLKFFFKLADYDKNLLKWKEMTSEEIIRSLEKSKELISGINDKDLIKDDLTQLLLAETANWSNKGELLWPLRVALSGQKNSPPPFDIIEILGKKEVLTRIETAIGLL
jgi:glutamyl-tRNA synthetase